jgi:hypothetical protein
VALSQHVVALGFLIELGSAHDFGPTPRGVLAGDSDRSDHAGSVMARLVATEKDFSC